MSVVCIDIGNTSIHLGAWRDGQLSARQELGEIEREALCCYLKSHQAKAVVYCSVVPERAVALESVLRQEKYSFHRLTCEDTPGLTINYPNPHEIGQDRLANAMAAQALYGAPAIVIDMGTAVTFDILGKTGAYEGGVIAPGLAIMTRYLHEQTALLPELKTDDLITSANIGKSTIEAMQLGCAVGFTGMIKALLSRVLEEVSEGGKRETKIIGTGGSAGILLKDLNQAIIIDKDITLKGLGEFWKRKQ